MRGITKLTRVAAAIWTEAGMSPKPRAKGKTPRIDGQESPEKYLPYRFHPKKSKRLKLSMAVLT